ncbi:hypothetical protein [Rhizocola hellebori]|nr:hypothetical protein [Rhizocola hellebori]
MTGRFLLAVAAGTALLFATASTASAATAVQSGGVAPAAVGANLTGATITFFTLDENKDDNTFVRVQVRDENGALASTTSGFFGEFKDGTTRGPLPMTVRSGIKWETLTFNSVTISIVPDGNDTWRFGFEVDLFFSDGSVEPEFIDFVSLSQNHRSEAFEFVF